MTRTNPQLDKLFAIADPVCTGAGYELVDLRLVMEQGGWVLRVFIDRAGGVALAESPVDLADCERMSRELGAVLDVEDPIPQHYSLEVSSPGLDRPLRTAAHYRRFVGEEVRVTLRLGLDGRRNFRGRIAGVEPADASGVEPGARALVDVDGTRFQLPLDDIEQARLIPDWDAVLGTHKKGEARGSGGAGNKAAWARKADRDAETLANAAAATATAAAMGDHPDDGAGDAGDSADEDDAGDDSHIDEAGE
jgi:ribosome maturation factor RimP